MAVIEKHYTDALGARHTPPRETIGAIEEALRGRVSRRAAQSTTLVVTEGSCPRVGRAELLLEDGTFLTIDDLLPRGVRAGYHELRPRRGRPSRLIVAPSSCYLPDDFHTWGWAIQVYAARSRRSWGIGDLADLRWLGRWASEQGAGIALINPLAASAPGVPQQASPYFPSSRRFRNPLYLHVEDMDGARDVDAVRALAERGRALNARGTIERDEIFKVKGRAFDLVWKRVRNRRDPAFERFVAGQGAGLEQFATYCALAERHGANWREWPARLRHPGASGVRAAARADDLRDSIRFHQWLQFQLDRQLAHASAEMPIMQDLPIGFDPDGADAWAFQDVLADGISVGAPPDEFNTKGQNWGLPPFVPDRLREAGYAPFVETIRGCLRHAGGLRIDHVMGLFRLFWIPGGRDPKDGAYVRGYADDLLAIIALESQRARAVIVGEDLGTVEERAREQLTARKILSYRLVWFEKTPPAKFPERALAAVSTHDLPTIAGLWSDRDLEEQRALGLSPNEAGTREIKSRVRRLTRGTSRTSVGTIISRVHEALARAPSRIVTATLDDAMAAEDRPNMPATTSGERANWSIPLPRTIETLRSSGLARRIGRALSRRG
jgi:4-alpha-glucanotransferase